MKFKHTFFVCGGWLVLTSLVAAQGPARPNEQRREASGASDASTFITRLMGFDKNNDGKLSKSEVTDNRLHALISRADGDGNGEVTKDELTALFNKESASLSQGGRGAPGGAGVRDDRGNPPQGGPGGGRAGFGPPQPGQVLPLFLRESLNLNAEQQKQLDELQRDVDARLSRILTEAQRRQLQEQSQRGPGGGRGPGAAPGGGPGGADRPPQRRPD